jgi:hypothetical protein
MEQLTRPGLLLRLEGLAAFALGAGLYWQRGESWLLFVLLFFTPDFSFLGYLAGTRVGAVVYNTVHTYALPAALGAAGLLGNNNLAVALALIWAAHIGLDRVLGFGLKYPSAFKDTHLARV